MRIKTIEHCAAVAATSRPRKLLTAAVALAVSTLGAAAFAAAPYPEGEPGSTSHPTVEPPQTSQNQNDSNATSSGGLSTVNELWVSHGEVRFILSTCDRYFRIAANDADRANAYDMLLSALLSNKKVTVFNPSLAPFTACPTTNTLAGSVRVQP